MPTKKSNDNEKERRRSGGGSRRERRQRQRSYGSRSHGVAQVIDQLDDMIFGCNPIRQCDDNDPRALKGCLSDERYTNGEAAELMRDRLKEAFDHADGSLSELPSDDDTNAIPQGESMDTLNTNLSAEATAVGAGRSGVNTLVEDSSPPKDPSNTFPPNPSALAEERESSISEKKEEMTTTSPPTDVPSVPSDITPGGPSRSFFEGETPRIGSRRSSAKAFDTFPSAAEGSASRETPKSDTDTFKNTESNSVAKAGATAAATIALLREPSQADSSEQAEATAAATISLLREPSLIIEAVDYDKTMITANDDPAPDSVEGKKGDELDMIVEQVDYGTEKHSVKGEGRGESEEEVVLDCQIGGNTAEVEVDDSHKKYEATEAGPKIQAPLLTPPYDGRDDKDEIDLVVVEKVATTAEDEPTVVAAEDKLSAVVPEDEPTAIVPEVETAVTEIVAPEEEPAPMQPAPMQEIIVPEEEQAPLKEIIVPNNEPVVREISAPEEGQPSCNVEEAILSFCDNEHEERGITKRSEDKATPEEDSTDVGKEDCATSTKEVTGGSSTQRTAEDEENFVLYDVSLASPTKSYEDIEVGYEEYTDSVTDGDDGAKRKKCWAACGWKCVCLLAMICIIIIILGAVFGITEKRNSKQMASVGAVGGNAYRDDYPGGDSTLPVSSVPTFKPSASPISGVSVSTEPTLSSATDKPVSDSPTALPVMDIVPAEDGMDSTETEAIENRPADDESAGAINFDAIQPSGEDDIPTLTDKNGFVQDAIGNAPVATTSGAPTVRPTTLPSSTAPTQGPSGSPESGSPTAAPVTSEPSSAPISDSPTQIPSASPVSDPPTAPPVSDPPTKGPSASPVSHAPTASPVSDPPTAAPVTDSPTRSPSVSPTSSPVAQDSTTSNGAALAATTDAVSDGSTTDSAVGIGGSDATGDDDGDVDGDVDVDATTETSTPSECAPCTNIPTPYMLKNNVTCATYSYAFERRCGTEFGWWGRNGNPEHCQYSCWANDVPFPSQEGAPCCERDEVDDDVASAATGAEGGEETTPDNIGEDNSTTGAETSGPKGETDSGGESVAQDSTTSNGADALAATTDAVSDGSTADTNVVVGGGDAEISTPSECAPCSNIPTPYMLSNNSTCYSYAFDGRCGTDLGWGHDGNPEYCQYSCWTNGVPSASQEGAPCCERDEVDDAVTTEVSAAEEGTVSADKKNQEEKKKGGKISTPSECASCTNIPTPYMLSNNSTCYSYAFDDRCGTDLGWGRDGNPEYCQYSCWVNGVPSASQEGAPCCERDEVDDAVTTEVSAAEEGTVSADKKNQEKKKKGDKHKGDAADDDEDAADDEPMDVAAKAAGDDDGGGDDDDDDDNAITEISTPSECAPCSNIPTPYMLSNNSTCHSYAFDGQCGTDLGWGRDGNPEYCQYSCWMNGVPSASQEGAPCCERDEADDAVTTDVSAAEEGTLEPSATPTAAPVSDPPTQGPSASPASDPPTKGSSTSPVSAPPTASPVSDPPTKGPSASPVSAPPTASPVSDPPTKGPSTSPVSAPPTASPVSDPPTKGPSASPVSFPPTASPVSDPPTAAPVTSEPSSAPVSDSPTHGPSASPVSDPPTHGPSASPVSTPEPTARPTSEPSAGPTTPFPSTSPTLNPTSLPTPLPIIWEESAPGHLVTSNNRGKATDGIMLAVTAKTSTITITSIDILLDSVDTNVPVEVMTMQGSYFGYELYSRAWRTVGAYTIPQGNGPSRVTMIQGLNPITIPPGKTIGLYIFFPEGHKMLIGSGGEVTSDGDIRIYSGSSVPGKFMSVERGVGWSGAIKYSIVEED